MLGLTKQQQTFVCVVLLLLATGWIVKTCRNTHAPSPALSTPMP